MYYSNIFDNVINLCFNSYGGINMNLFFSKIKCKAENVYFSLNKNKFAVNCKLPDGFTVTYHAGALNTAPNTVSSVEAATEDNAQIVEFDVSFRPDGTPVIIHNSEPDSTQGVFLDEALRVVAEHPKCKINLDIKSMKNLGVVDELVKRYGLFDRVFYTGVFEDWVETVKSTSDIPYYLNYNVSANELKNEAVWQAIADKVKNCGAVGINSNYRNTNKRLVEFMQKNGLLVSLWTVNKIADMPKVLAYCPDNITTKKPQFLKRLAFNQK